MNESSVFGLKNWHVRRGNEVEIGPVDLDLHAGQTVVFMGPSGVGKTTLLLSLLGFEAPDLHASGIRRWAGKTLSAGELPTRTLYIPQHLPFNPNWEIRGYLCRLPWGEQSWLDRIWPTRPRRIRRVREVLRRLGIAHRERATVAELSGGEVQLAALSQIDLLEPRLIVGDEFVSSLDPGMTVTILQECRHMIEESAGIGLLALHDVHAAMQVGDHIIMIWPPGIERQPWQVSSGQRSWDPEILHAILCVARWCASIDASERVRHFVSILRAWCVKADNLYATMEQYAPLRSVSVFDDGSIQPTRADVLKAIVRERSRHLGGTVIPMLIQDGTTIALAVSFPRPDSTEEFMLVVEAHEPMWERVK